MCLKTLAQNNLRAKAAGYLANALTTNNTLKHLYLGTIIRIKVEKNTLSTGGAKILASTLEINKGLMALILCSSKTNNS